MSTPSAPLARRLLPLTLAVLAALSACTPAQGAAPTPTIQDSRRYEKPSDAEVRRTVSPPAHEVTQKGAPEQRDASPFTETALLAGGCFWGMEDLLRKIPGVVQTEVGYTGGSSAFRSPTYREVSTGKTGHAEAVRVVFDPTRLTYETLLERWFFRMHDPTTLNRQGNDVGTQYRSAIFYLSDAQKRVAEEVKARVDASRKWPRPVVTQIVPASAFTPAEDYHQDYLVKNPGGYTCHYMRD